MELNEKKKKDNSNDGRGLSLVTDGDDHAQFASWLSQEEPDAVDNVDGGTYGRPVTLEGVQKGYLSYAGRFDEHLFPWRRGVLESTSSFYACLEGPKEDERIGHIDCLTVRSHPTGGSGSTDVLLGWIFMVYVRPDFRGAGYGRRMVELACSSGFPDLVDRVRCTVMRDNAPALRFYQRIGFRVVETHVLPGDFLVDVIEYTRR